MSDIAGIVESRLKELQLQAQTLLTLVDKELAEDNGSSQIMYALSGSRADYRLLEKALAEKRRELSDANNLQTFEQQQLRRKKVLAGYYGEAAKRHYFLEQAIATHIQGLASFKTEIEALIQKENKRAFWNGFWTNALFFILGLATSAIPLLSTKIRAFIGG